MQLGDELHALQRRSGRGDKRQTTFPPLQETQPRFIRPATSHFTQWPFVAPWGDTDLQLDECYVLEDAIQVFARGTKENNDDPESVSRWLVRGSKQAPPGYKVRAVSATWKWSVLAAA
jgi:hypothetical protein